MDDKAYFNLYEERYRRLREQGINDWVSNPEELISLFKHVDEFLAYFHCQPSKSSIIEFGSGQGHLADYLLNKGYKYFGIDISESAIIHAREKTGLKGQKAFLRADITNLEQLRDNSFDIAINNQCFHMLITDAHRKKYLAEVKRILKKDGKVFFRENFQAEEFKIKIKSLQEFDALFTSDQKNPHTFRAYVDNKSRTVILPRIPARPNNEAGYRKELKDAGFEVNYFEREPPLCIIYASLNRK